MRNNQLKKMQRNHTWRCSSNLPSDWSVFLVPLSPFRESFLVSFLFLSALPKKSEPPLSSLSFLPLKAFPSHFPYQNPSSWRFFSVPSKITFLSHAKTLWKSPLSFFPIISCFHRKFSQLQIFIFFILFLNK